MIDVLIVEDSRVTRDYLVYLLEQAGDLRVVGAVESGEAALAFLAHTRPDVILMDIHLPGIDGLETTRRILATDPVPIVVCTASTRFTQVHDAMRALDAGALAVLRKPAGLGDFRAEPEAAAVIEHLRLMSEVKMVRRWPPATGPRTAPRIEPPPGLVPAERGCALVAMGASTGGPPVVATILSQLGSTFPVPVLLVQHISAGFTAGLVEWLGSVAPMPVELARAGVLPQPGRVYVAPDHHHLRLDETGRIDLSRAAPHHGPRPSVGVLFRSVAERYGAQAAGVLLTGMGRDGAEELGLMAAAGALTIAQDERSSVVFGMPGEAVRLGAARHVLPPAQIADLLNAMVRPPRRSRRPHA
ncbi:MAG: chemotaxis protein CheB [Pseudomonadota bacterium]